MAEANEAPADAARRELKEELGLDLHVHELLCVDWVSPHGPWDDSLMFVFDGGLLNEHQIQELHLVDEELGQFSFYTEDDAKKLLRPHVWRRVEAALESLNTGRARYLEGGR